MSWIIAIKKAQVHWELGASGARGAAGMIYTNILRLISGKVNLFFRIIFNKRRLPTGLYFSGLVSLSGYDEGEIRVYLDGANYGEYQYEDGEEITITK
jgi:hypothetical protein